MRLNHLLREFTPSRTEFSKILTDSSLHMGFECEVMLPQESDEDNDGEVDWEYERERINNMDWSEVENYVRGHRQRSRIERGFDEWLDEKIEAEWSDARDEAVRNYCLEHNLISEDEPSDEDDEILDNRENIDAAHDEWIKNEEEGIREQYSMDDYIQSDYSDMAQFVSDYNIDIEPDEDSYRRSESSVEQVHEEAAYSLGEAVGDDVKVGRGGPDDWHVEEDGSLKGEGTGMEIVSPVFSMSEGLDALKKVFEWINDYNADTNKTTGLHVSFSIEGKTADDYDYLKMIVLYDENYTADLFNRLSNGFAQQMRDGVFRNLNNKTDASKWTSREINTAVAVLKKFSPSLHSISEKYFSFRHRAKGVFEFRTMGNAGYQDRYDIIRKRIVAMAAIMKVGSDPTLMAKEYLSRVYKMLTSEKFSTPDLTTDATRSTAVDPASTTLSSFSQMFARRSALAKISTTNPAEFVLQLIDLLSVTKTFLDSRQVRQLRLYVKKHGMTPATFDHLREKWPDRFNLLANYLRWPLIVPGDQRQSTLPFTQPGAERPEPVAQNTSRVLPVNQPYGQRTLPFGPRHY